MPQATPDPNTLGDVVQRCQSLLSGNTSSVGLYTRAYLVPFIQQAYSSMAKQIKNASGKNFEAIIEVLSIPVGTTDLSVYQKYVAPPNNQRGPLVGLFDPLRLWAKVAGSLPQWYAEARGPRDTLPHVNPPGITPGNYSVVVTYSWIGQRLFITPVAGAIDLQVYGRFNPPRLQSDDDVLLLYDDMTDTLAFAAAALTGVERSNTTILQGYAEQAVAGIDNIVADIIRQCQKNPRRIAKMGGIGGSYWGWGGSSIT